MMRRWIADHGVWVVLVAGTIIAAQWEIGYGEELGLAPWHGVPTAVLVPVAVDGYLWVALARRQDELIALGLFMWSIAGGALRHAIDVPPAALAISTAVLLSLAIYRAHLMSEPAEHEPTVEEHDRSLRYEPPSPAMLPADLEPVARPVTPAPVTPLRPVTAAEQRPRLTARVSASPQPATDDVDGAGEGSGGRTRGKWDGVRLEFLEAARLGQEWTREQLATRMRTLDPAATADAVRTLHNRCLRDLAKEVA